MNKKITTLCLINKNGKVLLGMKKRGFGEGRWNGFGGKVHDGETIEETAMREIKEEAGITPIGMKKFGVILFKFKENGLEGNPDIEVNIFGASDFKGEITESEEMRPMWFAHGDIPFEDMWPDDKYWVSMFLAGKTFKGEFVFDDINTIISHDLEEVESL
ncbi:MAG: hypothetical protein ACD_8C00067G0015 [uncultured bacterium]|nr:MAG: hypothetical protein ACD_8C00067G0015 [uncultured bacterium]